jgi:hypothetical protein
LGKSSDGATVKWDFSRDKNLQSPQKDLSVRVLEGKDFSVGLDAGWEEN